MLGHSAASPRLLRMLAVVLAMCTACQGRMGPEFVDRAPGVMERLRTDGEARVTVSLMVSDLAPGDEPTMRDIERARSAVLATLDTADFRETHRFQRVAALGGVLRSERGLRILLDHPDVRRVDLEVGGQGTR